MEPEVKTKTITVDKLTEIKYKKKGAGPGWHAGIYTDQAEWININCFKEEQIKQILEGVKVGQTYKVFLEMRGKYENVKSFVPIEQEKTYANMSDNQVAQMAADSPGGKGVGSQSASKQTNLTDYQKREDNKQKMIVRQSSLNYATQLVTIFATWDMQNAKDMNKVAEGNLHGWAAQVKEIAKEYEKQIMEGI